ncbi:hypothetical protein AB0C11_07245 [Streptomyces sp. NPDC039016]|uniref:hypothetical protein n=1 Tax=Streptomyces sp. NPDC039016 TaxID=3154330 RepID=UPI0033F4496F
MESRIPPTASSPMPGLRPPAGAAHQDHGQLRLAQQFQAVGRPHPVGGPAGDPGAPGDGVAVGVGAVDGQRKPQRQATRAAGEVVGVVAGVPLARGVAVGAVDTLGFTDAQAAGAGTAASVVVIVCTPLAALAADRFGLRRITLIGILLHIVAAFPMFWLAETRSVPGLWLAMCLPMLASTIAYAAIGTLVSGWFSPAPGTRACP